MLGAGVTVKGIALLGTPPTYTITLPEVPPAGTGTWMLVFDQKFDLLCSPLNVT
jgi:hypothetical protein